MARLKVFENANCVAFMAFSNYDHEEFDDINERVSENDVYITGYVYNKYCNCVEPYYGVSAKEKGAYKRVKGEMLEWLSKSN